MATRLKPTRINVDNTPRVGDGAAYQNDNDFHWSMGGGDMAYEDFEWVTLTGNSLVIENISNNVTPTGNFTVSAGTLKPGIEYVLRVNTGNTAYTMTLGTGVTNPNGYSTELTPNKVNQFKFIATSDSQLELEGVDTSEYLTGLTILSYGNSTWNDFITAYQKKSIVYCRASSESNPATGSQNRLAFMAYVNNATSPTEVEFQYYRSRSSHSTAQTQQDEVYVYKLTSTSGGTWTVTPRDTAARITTGTGLTNSYTTSSGITTMTIANDGVLTVNGSNGTVIVNDIKQSATAPDNPTAGTAWYDTTNGVLKVYNGTAWDNIATGGAISNTAYGSAWDGQTTTAPSQNAVYDKISSIDALIPSEATSSNKLADKNYVDAHDTIVSAAAPSSPTEGMVWYDTTNDQLKVYNGSQWNVTGKEYNAGPGIEIGTYNDYSAMRGPAPEGFHVPLSGEWESIISILTTTFSMSSNNSTTATYLKMPNAGYRYWTTASPTHVGDVGGYRAANDGRYLRATSTILNPNYNESKSCAGRSVRLFKDVPEIPDSTWTVLYDGSSIASNAGIFHNITKGLISVSGDGQTWITIADKNLGATTAYNNGATLSESNCGGYFQKGNNYMFSFDGNVTTSSTQVDASTYGPDNYYSSSTFITGSGWWDSSDNNNLWGGVTGVITIDNAITNTGVLSVNGQTGNVTIQNENNVKVFETANNVVIQGGDFTNDATLVAQIQEMVEWLTEDSNHAACIVYKENSGGSVHVVTLYVYEADNATMGASDKLLEFYYMSQDGDAIYYQYGHIDIISGAVSSASISNRNVVANKFSPLNSGTTGQVLTKTSSGYNWQDASGGFELAPNSPLTPKYRRYGTQAQYEALAQYYTDEPGDTVYFTI